MSRPKIDDETKKREGAFVKAAFERAQELKPELTVESLAGEIGCSQGLVSQWFSGRTNIADKQLIWLGTRLGFDPVSLRPGLRDYGRAKDGDILDQYDAIPSEDRDLIDAMIRRAYERHIAR